MLGLPPILAIPATVAGLERYLRQTTVTPDPGSVGAEAIETDAVTTAKILNDAVTYAKIQNVSATDRLLGRSTAGAGDVEEIACTAAGRAILDDANAAAQRTTLGLAIGTDVQAWDADLDTVAANITAAGHALIDDANAAAQRTTLGLGTAATQNTGTSGATVPLLDGANTWTNAQTFSAPPLVPSYTVAGVPSASPAAQIAYISNEAGGAVLAFADGTNWRRCTDRAIIS